MLDRRGDYLLRRTGSQFEWPMGDIIIALATNDMRIDHLSEYPSKAKWRFEGKLEEAQTLPGTYLLTASKEGQRST